MSYPTTPAFNAINLKSNDPTLYSEAVNGRMQSRKIGGQKWMFTASYATMTRSEFQPVFAFVTAQRGRHGVFTVIPTGISTTNGSGSGTVTTSAASKGAVSVSVTGLTGDLKAGDVVKFAGHDKVYMLTADRTGNGAIAITPPLVEAVGAEQLIYSDVPFTVRLSNDMQSYKVGSGMFYNFEVDFIEALS